MSEEKVNTSVSTKKNKMNLIDVVLIVLLVLILGAFLAYRFFVAGDASETVYLEYCIEIRNVGENVNTALLEGDTLYNGDDEPMGTVVGCSKVKNETLLVKKGEDTFLEETVFYITVTVGCDATKMRDGSYRVGDATITVGDALALFSNDFVLEGSCVQMSEVIK